MKTGLSCSACLPGTRKPVNQGDLSISNRWGTSARGSQHTRRDLFFESFHAKPAGDEPPADAPLPALILGTLSRRGAGLRPELAPSLLPGADAPFLKRERDASQGSRVPFASTGSRSHLSPRKNPLTTEGSPSGRHWLQQSGAKPPGGVLKGVRGAALPPGARAAPDGAPAPPSTSCRCRATYGLCVPRFPHL